jgi:hypothetical protein
MSLFLLTGVDPDPTPDPDPDPDPGNAALFHLDGGWAKLDRWIFSAD